MTVVSWLAVAMVLPSGLNAADNTQSLWPVRGGDPGRRSHAQAQALQQGQRKEQERLVAVRERGDAAAGAGLAGDERECADQAGPSPT